MLWVDSCAKRRDAPLEDFWLTNNKNTCRIKSPCGHFLVEQAKNNGRIKIETQNGVDSSACVEIDFLVENHCCVRFLATMTCA
jgi:hypothetical protein